MGRLDGKRVLVTGASRGIGRAIAEACAAEGAIVGAGFRRSLERAAEVKGAAHLVAIDVTDPSSVEQAVAGFVRDAGRIDALVANAGYHSAGLLATQDLGALEELVRTNVLGPLVCARAVLGPMLAQRGGTLLFVGSVAATRPSRGQAAYASTKASVEALTRAIAVEYGRKAIRAVCIRPGAVATDMLAATMAMAESEITARIPARKIAEPEEIARVAAMLLSDDAAYINGAVVDVDGGYAVG